MMMELYNIPDLLNSRYISATVSKMPRALQGNFTVSDGRVTAAADVHS